MEKDKSMRKWEQDHINDLTLQLILLATIGTLVATIITFILRKAGMADEIRPELLFIPWGIALVFAVSVGFRRGVMAERQRVEKSRKKKRNNPLIFFRHGKDRAPKAR